MFQELPVLSPRVGSVMRTCTGQSSSSLFPKVPDCLQSVIPLDKPNASSLEFPSGQISYGTGTIAPVPEISISDLRSESKKSAPSIAFSGLPDSSSLPQLPQQSVDLRSRRQEIATAAAIENGRSFPAEHPGVITRSMTRSGSSGTLPLSKSS